MRRRRHLRVVRPGYRPPARRVRDLVVVLLVVALFLLFAVWRLGDPAPPP